MFSDMLVTNNIKILKKMGLTLLTAFSLQLYTLIILIAQHWYSNHCTDQQLLHFNIPPKLSNYRTILYISYNKKRQLMRDFYHNYFVLLSSTYPLPQKLRWRWETQRNTEKSMDVQPWCCVSSPRVGWEGQLPCPNHTCGHSRETTGQECSSASLCRQAEIAVSIRLSWFCSLAFSLTLTGLFQ